MADMNNYNNPYSQNTCKKYYNSIDFHHFTPNKPKINPPEMFNSI